MGGTTRLALCVALLVILDSVGNINALKCYECLELHDDLKKLGGKDTPPKDFCKNKIPKGTTQTCPAAEPYCLTATGKILNGKSIVVKHCVSDLYKRVFGNAKCRPVSEIPEFKYNLGNEEYQPESGNICLCNTDKCNSTPQTHPMFGILIAGILVAFFRF